MGDTWHFGYGYLGDGDDVYFTNQPDRNRIMAGPGDDIVYSLPYDEKTLEMVNEVMWGEEGNDLLYGSHKVTMN